MTPIPAALKQWINRLPIKAKLLLLILLTSVVALLVEGIGFVAYERVRVKQELMRDLGSLARVIADRSTAALTFNDDRVATETLAALKVKSVVTAACIYDGDGKVFARYDSDEEPPFAFPVSDRFVSWAHIDGEYLHLTEPIVMDGAPIGSVFIRASLRELALLWQKFLLFAGLIAFLTSLITLWIASRIQRFISQPLENLTSTVEAIAAQKDYSLRATQTSDDEVGTLVRAFNGMVSTIETRNRDLLDANQRLAESEERLRSINEELERRVDERTRGLRTANDEMKAIFDSAGLGIAFINDRRFQRYNRRIEEMFGWSTGEIIGQLTRVIYPSDEAYANLGARGYSVIARGETFVSEEILRRKDGSTFWGQLSGHAVDPADPASGSVWLVEDITERRRAAEELREAKEIAEEATKSKSMFLANMSHEIRTPMNAILGMLYLALKTDLPPALHNYLSKAQGAAHSLLGIINDILDFSKIEAGKLDIEQVEFGLDAVLEQLTDAIGYQVAHKGIEFLIRYDVTIPPLLVGDPLRLGQVMLNLCSNAVKFTEQGEVELAFRRLNANETDLTIQVCVRDSGIGMAPEVQAKLFEKFSQADQSTTRRFGGTGLGLAISKNLVELMGGRIWVEDSQPDKGTTICFTVQLKVARQSPRSELVEQVGPLLQGIRVLVVDDNEVSREILAEMLRFFHLEVGTAPSGPAALAALAAAENPYDLVLMDWRMPGMNGDEATQRIHRETTFPRQPKVVMVTAYGREDVIHLAEQAGVDGFLVKPVSPSTLLDTILSVLGRGRLLSSDEQRRDSNPALASSIQLAGARLLLVEDNDINREFATELLRSEGIAVETAVDGQDALDKVQQQDYDAVLMDIQMPVMDGLEAARRIRALAEMPGSERFAKLPIIAMTALAMAQDAEKSQAAGMNDHVSKPIMPDRLMAALTKWVHLPASGASPAERAAEAPPDLLALASLDTREGIRRIGGKTDAYRKQLRRFREHYGDAVTEMRRLAAELDIQRAAEYCHALRGVTGNIGAQMLYDKLAEIDARLKLGTLPDAAALAEMHELLQAVILDIESLAATPVPAPAAAAVPLAPARLRELLARLAHVLENDLGAAEPLLGELRAGTSGTPIAAQIAAIAASVDVFDTDAALAQLGTLQERLDRPN